MNKIETLIKELCPDGVKWMKIKYICSLISSGGTPRRDNDSFYDGSIPWLRTQEVNFKEIYDTGLKITEDGLKNSSAKYIKENCVIVAMYGATAGKVAINKIPLTTNQACCNLEINPDIASYKYVYHWLFKNYKTLKDLGQGSQSNINSKILKEFNIPIPPLEIQEEIVKILDKFTDYVTELTTELTLRQKQYNYYRDKLLSFENEFYQVEWKTIEQVFDVFAGGDIPKNNFSEQKTKRFSIPILSNGIGEKSLYGWTDIPKIESPSLTISARGTIGWTSHQVEPFYPIVRLLVLTPKIPLNLRYAYYYMKHIEDRYDVPESGIPQLTKPMINNKQIPIPSIEIQSRIVQVLDNFDTVCNDLNIGLPKEIELRQKQYEFFRDNLLTFAAEGVYTDSTVQTRHN